MPNGTEVMDTHDSMRHDCPAVCLFALLHFKEVVDLISRLMEIILYSKFTYSFPSLDLLSNTTFRALAGRMQQQNQKTPSMVQTFCLGADSLKP